MGNIPPIWRTCYVACHTVTTNHMLTIMLIYCYYGDDPKSLFWSWPSDLTFQVPIISLPTRALATSSPVRFKLSVSFPSNPDLPSVFPLCHPPGFPAAYLCDSLNFSLSCAAFCQVLQIHHPPQLTTVLSPPCPWPLCPVQAPTASVWVPELSFN